MNYILWAVIKTFTTLCLLFHQHLISTCIRLKQSVHLLIYRLKTFSICFCWNLPLITSWLFPSMEPLKRNKRANRHVKPQHWPTTQPLFSKHPQFNTRTRQKKVSYLVPSSANKKASRCFGWRCNLNDNNDITMSMKNKKYVQFKHWNILHFPVLLCA